MPMVRPSISDWLQKRSDATQLNQERQDQPDVLIEVSAQHPLRDGLYPAEEFEARLLRGIELRQQLVDSTRGKIMMLVNGSRHREGNLIDQRSLSEAGGEFLYKKGVPTDVILGEETMTRFKGSEHTWPGVYNSADEAYVAASLFKEEPTLRELYCIVSAAQSTRKKLHYLWNGVLPTMISIHAQHAYHNRWKEWAMAIPYTLLIDPDWQSPESAPAKKSRIQREVTI